MKTYQTKIDDDVRSVLERSTITATSLTLPPGQLERKLYERVNKVLVAAGGTWNRGAKGHLFTKDPRTILGLALETGGIVDTKKTNGQFFTSPDLAEYVIDQARIKPGKNVLEPSAGAGALADAARSRGGEVECIEIDPVYVEQLRAKGYRTRCANFLHVDPPMPRFDRIVMNPPFNGHADIEHVLHAYRFLEHNGQLVSIMGAGVMTLSTAKGREFQQLVEGSGDWEALPDDSFVDAGTKVRTIIVTLEK